jgi:hypothetical protein
MAKAQIKLAVNKEKKMQEMFFYFIQEKKILIMDRICT